MMRLSLTVVIVSMLSCGVMAFSQQPDQSSASQTGSNQQAAATAPAPEFAHLRVYRQRRYAGSALAPSVFVDEKQVARVGNGRRFGLKLTPGTHTIKSDDKASAISLEAKAGQEYFIRVDETTGFWKGHGKLTMLMPEQGSAEYKLQKPIEADRRLAGDMLEDLEEPSASSEIAPKKDENDKKK